MKHLFLLLYLISVFYQLVAEEAPSLESPDAFSDWIELSLPDGIELVTPPSIYSDAWDPKQKLPLILPGCQVRQGGLIIDLDKAIQEWRKQQDLLRSQNNQIFETSSWPITVETRVTGGYTVLEDDGENEDHDEVVGR